MAFATFLWDVLVVDPFEKFGCFGYLKCGIQFGRISNLLHSTLIDSEILESNGPEGGKWIFAFNRVSSPVH